MKTILAIMLTASVLSLGLAPTAAFAQVVNHPPPAKPTPSKGDSNSATQCQETWKRLLVHGHKVWVKKCFPIQ